MRKIAYLILISLALTSFIPNMSFANELDNNGNWYRYKGDSKNTGISTAIGPIQPVILWKFTTGDNEIATNTAIDTDGTIYYGTKKGNFYALNKDGSLKWRYIGNEPILSTPAVSTKGVYVTTDKKVIGFSKTNGQVILSWDCDSTLGDTSSILFGEDEDVLYFTSRVWSNISHLYRLDISSSIPVVNKFSADYMNTSSPAKDAEGNIYFTDNSAKLHYINSSFVNNTKILFGSDMATTTPVVSNQGMIYTTAAKSGSSGGGRIYAFKKVNKYLVEQWTYILGTAEWFMGDSISVSKNDIVLFISTTNVLYAINPDGSLKWKKQISDEFLGDNINSIVTDDKENIYLLNNNNELLSFNINGNQRWVVPLGDEINAQSTLSIDKDGTIYVPTKKGNLIAIIDKSKINKVPSISIKSTTQRTGNQDLIYIEGAVKDENIGDKMTIKYSIKNTPILNKNVILTQPISIISNGQNQTFQGNINLNNFISGNFTLQIWAEDNKGGKSNVVEVPINIFNTLENILKSLKSYVYNGEVQFLIINSDTTIKQNQENDRLIEEIKKELKAKNVLMYFIGKDGPTENYIRSKLF